MLAEVSRVIIACGRSDLRKGIDVLSQIIGIKYNMNPFENDVTCQLRLGSVEYDVCYCGI